MRPSFAALWIRTLTKSELHLLVRNVKSGDSDAISRAVIFVSSESFGMWHNRARAKLCRHFKNHPPSDSECLPMVTAIVARLVEGRFYEQFKDQLSMAIRFDPSQLKAAAAIASESESEYVRRYAAWVQNVLATSTRPHDAG